MQCSATHDTLSAMKLYAVFIAAALAACGGKKDDKPAPSGGTATGSATTSAPTPPPPSQDAIDVCSFASRADVEGVLGKLSSDPEPAKRTGSLLGQCTYSTETGVATVMARPAREYEDTVEYGKPTTAIAGLGESATHTEKAGVHVKLAGKSYFLVAFVVDGAKGVSPEKSEQLAKLVVAGAK